jgi:hypothetical protein
MLEPEERFVFKRYNEYLRDLIVNGRARPIKIVSHHIAIDDPPDAYDKFDKRVDGYTKVLIKFGERQKAALLLRPQSAGRHRASIPFPGLALKGRAIHRFHKLTLNPAHRPRE